MPSDTLHVAIPAYAESAWLPSTLASLAEQSQLAFQVWVCVNQKADAPATAMEDNRATLDWLARHGRGFPFRLKVLDARDPAVFPAAHQAGVGWARRLLFESILAAAPRALCVSLDADVTLDSHYLAAVIQAFARHPNAVGLAAPFYHHCPSEPELALRLLRYECYLRHYQLSLWRIGSPYAFLPLGSAFAFRGAAYRRAGRMPLRQAGEDFYFLQQLRKTGPLIRWIDARVYPAARISDRVPFGTGPTLATGDAGFQEERYPFYDQASFDLLGDTFACFPRLFRERVSLPMGDFLRETQGGYAAFDKMRRNFKREDLFVKACHEKLDGLRTLQFLKYQRTHSKSVPAAERAIMDLLTRLDAPVEGAPFQVAQLTLLARLRDHLCSLEAGFQQRFMAAWDMRARW